MKNLFKRIKNLLAGLAAISNTERLAIWIEYTEQRQKQHNDRIVELEKKAANNRESNVTLAGDVGATKGEITGLKKQVAANTKLLDMMKKRDVIQTQNDLEFTKEFESLKQDLAKLRDGKVNENTQAVKELREAKKALHNRIKEQSVIIHDHWKSFSNKFLVQFNKIQWLENELYPTKKFTNPEKLAVRIREAGMKNPMPREIMIVLWIVVYFLQSPYKLPMKKTAFNKAVYDESRKRKNGVSRRDVRETIEVLIKQNWLIETQDKATKWIEVNARRNE